jgi:aryl-alcohol dehydrogenase-like predicted oxidoreductase
VRLLARQSTVLSLIPARPLYKKHGLGTAVFSALGAGLLTGKYNAGVPDDSRFARHGRFYAKTVANLGTDNGRAQIAQVRALGTVAEELGCSTAQLAIAWLVKNPDTSTVVLGASRVEQRTCVSPIHTR